MLQKIKVTSFSIIITLFIILILPISALSQKEVFSKDGWKGVKAGPTWNPPPIKREQSLVEEGERSDKKKVADLITTGGLSKRARLEKAAGPSQGSQREAFLREVKEAAAICLEPIRGRLVSGIIQEDRRCLQIEENWPREGVCRRFHLAQFCTPVDLLSRNEWDSWTIAVNKPEYVLGGPEGKNAKDSLRAEIKHAMYDCRHIGDQGRRERHGRDEFGNTSVVNPHAYCDPELFGIKYERYKFRRE